MCCCGQTLQQQHLSPSWAGGPSLWKTRITDALETSRVALVALGPRAAAALAEFGSPGARSSCALCRRSTPGSPLHPQTGNHSSPKDWGQLQLLSSLLEEQRAGEGWQALPIPWACPAVSLEPRAVQGRCWLPVPGNAKGWCSVHGAEPAQLLSCQA